MKKKYEQTIILTKTDFLIAQHNAKYPSNPSNVQETCSEDLGV